MLPFAGPVRFCFPFEVKALNKSKGINTSWQTNKAESETGTGVNGLALLREMEMAMPETRQQKPSKFLHRTFIFGCLSLHTLISGYWRYWKVLPGVLAWPPPHTRDAINLKKVNCWTYFVSFRYHNWHPKLQRQQLKRTEPRKQNWPKGQAKTKKKKEHRRKTNMKMPTWVEAFL